jgi:hypothetical protein
MMLIVNRHSLLTFKTKVVEVRTFTVPTLFSFQRTNIKNPSSKYDDLTSSLPKHE